jgi:DNA-binding response OmpR family regulator
MKLVANILLVDDDPQILRLLELTLTKASHRVATATNWQQVTEHINLYSRDRKAFDVIFLDLMMPDRSGYDILRSLNVILHPMPPVVILTALSGIDYAVQALELGATKFITKPISQEKLLNTVSEVLRGDRSSRF